MPPSESQILTSFLLPAGPPLPLPLPAFTALFPPSTPPAAVAHLHRHLAHQRARLTDAVRADIADEVRRGIAQRRAVVRTRRAQERRDDADADEEELVERALFTHTTPLPAPRRQHTLRTVAPALAAAAAALEAEIQMLEYEAALLLGGLRETVGGMSDLRYGRFGQAGVGDEVREGLEGLREGEGR